MDVLNEIKRIGMKKVEKQNIKTYDDLIELICSSEWNDFAILEGLDRSDNDEIIIKGVDTLRNKLLISTPYYFDIFVWVNNDIIPVTSFVTFNNNSTCNQKQSLKDWCKKNVSKFRNKNKGYYGINHKSKKTFWLGLEWDEIVQGLCTSDVVVTNDMGNVLSAK
jgi:hypothetical protein